MGLKGLFESDLNQTFRCLADNYTNADVPELQTAFFDIEVDFNKDRGFAPPSDPFNAITAVSIHLAWLNKTVCLAIKPSTLSVAESQTICNKFENCFLMDTEEELLKTFLELINDADVLSGWNSEGFDIPYIVNRTALVVGKDYTRKFCLWNQYPKRRMYEAYGNEQETFDLTGRVHLDYLQLYRKYTYHEMHSYSLDAIAEHELDEHKIVYEGTLDQLYNNDFEKFIEYNIQDTDLLRKLDDKLQFIDQANILAHANTVLLQTTMGAVAQTDQAIINEAHRCGFVVPDRRHDKNPIPAAGAYVANPVKGLHKWLASLDLNSLYPSILRSCNMSPECIVGQVRHTITGPGIQEYLDKYKDGAVAKYWEGKFSCAEYDLVMAKNRDTTLILDLEDGTSHECSGAELYDLIFMQGRPWSLSSNGTLFSFEKKGVIPGLLERWYSERKELQAKAKEFSGTDAALFAFWDKRQLVKKINLNSLYGALLNPGSRFFDQRLGQSTTLTGRTIARHMAAAVNELITGKYDHLGESIIYGDTDSVYFSAYPILKDEIDSGALKWDKDSIIEFYDMIGEETNKTFPGYMKQAHNCPESYGKIIAAGREVVGETGLFIIKKRYGIMVLDDDGTRFDVGNAPGKVKAMGLDLKRSDTPAFMQEFLKEILYMTLTGVAENVIITRIIEFRDEFRKMNPWEQGTPKRVNNLTNLTKIWNKSRKCRVGHALAAINYNNLLKLNNDKYSLPITDGMKTIVCPLKPNPLGITKIGIPIDEKHIPDWYKALPFDTVAMERAIVTKKLENLLGVLPWDLKRAENANTFNQLFTF